VTKDDIKNTVVYARRFLTAAALAMEEPDMAVTITGSKVTGNLRRASMELTRALADMRGNNKRWTRWKESGQ
jgi:uncharacterized membrane protein YoaK (UPF0700 family)